MTDRPNTARETRPDAEPTLRRFDGRVAIVTGGGSGIGAATARRLAEEGAAVVVVDLSAERAQATAEELAGRGAGTRAEVADVADAGSWAKVVQSAENAFGGVDVLVNGACAWEVEPAHTLSTASWQRQVESCLGSVFFGFQACHAALAARRGAVVNVSSVHALFGIEGHPAYAAAKGGVVSLTRQLAVEYGPRIRVNVVLPGPILTAAWERVPDEERARNIEMTVARRLGAPAEVAAAIAFLASEDASFMTGSSLVVDGGWSIWK